MTVQGTNRAPVPEEVRNYYKGKGVSIAFLKKRYGFRTGMSIRPTKEEIKARMVDTG